MGAFEWGMIFVMSWWVCLFMVLPFGSQLPEKAEAHHYHSAPIKVSLVRKLLVTTGLAIVVTLIVAGVIQSGWIRVT